MALGGVPLSFLIFCIARMVPQGSVTFDSLSPALAALPRRYHWPADGFAAGPTGNRLATVPRALFPVNIISAGSQTELDANMLNGRESRDRQGV